jgi:hypothetical protein
MIRPHLDRAIWLKLGASVIALVAGIAAVVIVAELVHATLG